MYWNMFLAYFGYLCKNKVDLKKSYENVNKQV